MGCRVDELTNLANRLDELSNALLEATQVADDTERTEKLLALQGEIQEIHRAVRDLHSKLMDAKRREKGQGLP